MGFFQFWILSTLFYLTFPLSLLIAFLVLGPVRTRQFVSALIHDFLQTVLILIAVFAVVAWGVLTLFSSDCHAGMQMTRSLVNLAAKNGLNGGQMPQIT